MCYIDSVNNIHEGGDTLDSMELKAAIARSGITNRELSSHLGISEQAFYNKVGGQSEFKNSEIKHLAVLLSLSMDAVNAIFLVAQ